MVKAILARDHMVAVHMVRDKVWDHMVVSQCVVVMVREAMMTDQDKVMVRDTVAETTEWEDNQVTRVLRAMAISKAEDIMVSKAVSMEQVHMARDNMARIMVIHKAGVEEWILNMADVNVVIPTGITEVKVLVLRNMEDQEEAADLVKAVLMKTMAVDIPAVAGILIMAMKMIMEAAAVDMMMMIIVPVAETGVIKIEQLYI
jgi:hypothetical protein